MQLLQRMVNTFASDIDVIRNCVAAGRAPERALRSLAASLIYVVDRLDLVPDDMVGIGIADDAAMLRLAARIAMQYGADDAPVRRLAAESAEVAEIYGSLLRPLEDYLNRLEWDVKFGKAPLDLLRDPEMAISLWKEIGRRISEYRSTQLIDPARGDAANFILGLRRVVKARLKNSGVA
jgi:uncharacterized membrane protein YkvA (DUF1232 family)